MRPILVLIVLMVMGMVDVRCQVDEKCVFPSTAYVTIVTVELIREGKITYAPR